MLISVEHGCNGLKHQLAPRKNKMQLTMLRKILNNSNLARPYKLFFLGAEENKELGLHCLLLLLYVRILLLLLLIVVFMALLVIDFSQKI